MANPAGQCRDCHGARWPCEMYQLAIQADRLDGYRTPWPQAPYQGQYQAQYQYQYQNRYQNRRGPIPPPRIRRGPPAQPAPPVPTGPPAGSYPPPGGPGSWPAQRVPAMPPPRRPYADGLSGGWPSGPAPARDTPTPARAAPGAVWDSRPREHPPPPAPDPRSWQSWPSSWTPDVPVPRQGEPYGHGWGQAPPARHSLGFPPPQQPRRELSNPLEDVLRWSR
ncbi:hypothetical protein [Pseudonocardia acaciae]|uniref:hypothetical protein n=1 Tax=Pseudonocardia acaciae TaxID=551276 RepID=UPI0012ED9EAD|nr:hypothetical protein [Pseudonocardia acaciae]